MRIAHLTSVHSRGDTRIFLKECRSLVNAGYETALVVADGRGDEHREGVAIHDVGLPRGRIDRVRRITRRVFDKAVAIDAAIYHLHDPELIPIGLRLRRMGRRVVFDSHEDVSKQLLGKPYLGPVSRRVLSLAFSVFERFTCGKFDAIVAATPFIRDKFLKINPRTVDINNFPMLGELSAQNDEGAARTKVCYVGGVEAIRGAREVIRAMEGVRSGVRLELAGAFSDPMLSAEVRQYEGWRQVDEFGFVDRAGVRAILGRSFAGLVTFLSAPNHVDAQPNKMFEYMSAGVPVIASHFPLWREIVEGNACGVCVDPSQPHEIAAAIDFFAENPDQVEVMGANGRRAVLDRYNWAMEEAKLLNLYESLSS
ncbi:MAG: glycosyltransferase [Azoarcus sp.]|jgi:glycosyltransferase involved in cell wall biosynthesis|nr:glycosyltransferase [Azoarcus sp.]